MSRFNYLIKKIKSKKLLTKPFPHLYIENFFKAADFKEIIGSPEVALDPVPTDRALIDQLHEKHFKEIDFPGTTLDLNHYLKWHQNPQRSKNSNVETCEGMGVTFRLQKTTPGTTLSEIEAFFKSNTFIQAIAAKFGIDSRLTRPDIGLQKYLDGYEISPHPDIRSKALTYMININPAPQSEKLEFHTHYLTFIPERAYVNAFWRGNPKMDRCWVPWSWCKTEKKQTLNNSLVMFSPTDDSLHAVKASYNHLTTQRTQFYGNLWYKKGGPIDKPNWRDLDVVPTLEIKNDTDLSNVGLRNLKFKLRSFLYEKKLLTHKDKPKKGY